MKRLPSLTNGSAGFTLIEIIISVVVLAIGLLGMAALQMNGLRNNQSAYFRAQATQLAYDMADRMRTNIVEASDPSVLNAGTYNNGAATTDICETGGTTCTTDQMTGYDFSQWNTELAAQLPFGTGTVCIDSTPLTDACDGTGTVYAIKVWWDDNRSGAANQRFVMSFQPWN
jgi:type IV pilus assembly protein PilV